MPFRITVEDGVIAITFFGAVAGADLGALATELFDLESRHPRLLPRVIDLSAATSMDLSFPDILALAERRRGQRYPNAFKSAIIAPAPVQFGLARMFQTLNDHPQITLRVFRDRTEALTWIHAAEPTGPSP